MKRRKDETYKDYVKRRKMLNKVIKAHLKGRLVWDSSPKGKLGTYYKPKKGN